MAETYGFTNEQLTNLLFGTIGMFIEYRDVHGKSEDSARFAAVSEMFEGTDAEIELAERGEVSKLSLSLGSVITVADHDRVIDQMNATVKQTRTERSEACDALKALRDWCDENLNGVPSGYAQIMERADKLIKLTSEERA